MDCVRSTSFSLRSARHQPHAKACTPNRLLVLLVGFPLVACGQLEWIPSDAPQAVFAGRAQQIKTGIRNPSDKAVELPVRMRLFQLSSATSMPVADARPWKTLKILANQTVQESAELAFPAVKARTMFEIQWLDAKGKLIGRTEVAVYPGDLLKQLATLANDKPIGVIDPGQDLIPSLKRLEIEFTDLDPATSLEKFEGKLAIVFQRSAKLPGPRHLSARVAARAKEGVAFVWVQPPIRPPPSQEPRAYTVRLGSGCVAVVQHALVANLPDSPTAQLNLIRFAELALRPELLQLPETP